MMWDPLIKLQREIETIFDRSLERYQEDQMDRFNRPGWVNLTWKSDKFRRAHIDVVDARESKKLWMMHVCIFPNLQSGAPIYGFDVISGPTKVTGAFHDFSPVNLNDPALKYFSDVASKYNWSKNRELPDWARAIFSGSMIAAGNIQTEKEIEDVVSLVTANTRWYVNIMNVEDDMPSSYAHNRYAYFQKQNPHTPRTMKALGLDEQDVDYFVSKCLFPEVE
jgi:hypothetical protein